MKTYLILFLFVGHYSLLAQTTLNVKTFGGAAGDGQGDDTPAIQQTIDAVSEAGGGTVFFPEGTYLVSPVAAPGFRQTVCLRIPSNIEMKGESKSKAVIKVKDSVIHYDGIIGPFPSFAQIENFTLRDMTLDGNGTNNPVTQEILNQGTSHTMLRIFLGDNLLVENCRFTDHKGVWIITFNGLIDGATVRNCTFEEIGDESVDWDHSTIYTNGRNFRIHDNTFTTRFGAGTFGARTAIETHGENQWVADNRIDGFVNGMNITGYSTLYESKNQVVTNNVITNVLIGIRLWAGSFGDSLQEIEPNGLEDVLLTNNTITVNVRDWTGLSFFNGGSGISFELDNDRKTENLFIYQNQISFLNTLPLALGVARKSVGILAGNQVLDPTVPINNWYIATNTISNSLGPGISLESVINGASVVNNTIINPGNNQGELFNAFRSGFFLSNTLNQVRINDNQIIDNRSPALTDHVGITYTEDAPGAYFFGNTDNLPSIQELTVSDETAGTAWKTTPDLPVVSFAADSSAVSATSFTLDLTIASPSSAPLTVGVKVLNRNSNVEDGLYLLDETFTIPANATTYQLPLTLEAKFLAEDNRPLVVLDQSPNYITGRYTFTRLVKDSETDKLGTGLQAAYFANRNLTGAFVLSRVDSVVAFNWQGGSPAPNLPADNFSVRWQGQVQPQYSEEYTFYTQADDGTRLWVNGKLLIDDWTNHAVREKSSKITLEAGKKYDIKLEYYENGGRAVCKLLWSSASQNKQVISKAHLYNQSDGNAARLIRQPSKESPTIVNPVRVYPNPSSGQFILESIQTENSQISLYDLLGKRIPLQIQLINAQQLHVQPQGQVPEGLYLLHIRDATGSVILRKITFTY